MLLKRIIPCLDMKAGRVVKGVMFADLRDAGDPVETASLYDRMGADEICLLDITATLEDREALWDVVHRTAAKVFLPLTVGGGVRQVEDMRRLLLAGADKVSVNSAAISDPSLLSDCARRFGSQCVVLAVDAKKAGAGYRVFTHGGTRDTGIDVFEWISQGVSRGAGEILLTAIDRDGTKSGYDLDLIRRVSQRVNVPIIASGGAGSMEDFQKAFEAGADAALAASLFHFGEISLPELKKYLSKQGSLVRALPEPAETI
ncbi:MAG: imidazole glycerol phosphate synthase subunit HisF, partial [Leptospirillum sp.]